jgi:hypothetical protein
MIVVIQCAARKSQKAGYLRTRDGRKVLFVAQPDKAWVSKDIVYARPDDPSDRGGTWREALRAYNESPADNPDGLLPAIALYGHPAYARLEAAVPTEKLYILSAGWGLISSAFLTPAYDITFSTAADDWKRRRKGDRYDDLRMLPGQSAEEVVFFGGKDYLPLFCALTGDVRGQRTVVYNAATLPAAPGCRLVRYSTKTRTNWHYEAAEAWLAGKLVL